MRQAANALLLIVSVVVLVYSTGLILSAIFASIMALTYLLAGIWCLRYVKAKTSKNTKTLQEGSK
jgi:hypothetical protein